MPQWLASAKPTNRILQGPPDTPLLDVEIGANATAADMVPGRIVIHDAIDGDVKEAAAKARNPIGVLEVKSGMLVTDAYAVGDDAVIIPRSSGARVVLTLITGSVAVAPGDSVVTAANGKAAKQAVGGAGLQGTVVAHALETQDPTSADKACLCELSSSAEPEAAS